MWIFVIYNVYVVCTGIQMYVRLYGHTDVPMYVRAKNGPTVHVGVGLTQARPN